MVSLKALRNRIHSANNIKQITKAMELVAGSQLGRAELKAAQSKLYRDEIQTILHKIYSDCKGISHPAFVQRSVEKTGLVIVSSDRGLCGSYNANIFLAATKFLKNYSPDKVELTLIGRKAIEHFRHWPWHVDLTVPEWSGKISHSDIKTLALRLLNKFLDRELDEIWIIYTDFQNLLTREVKTEKLLDIAPSNTKSFKGIYIFEPKGNLLLPEALTRWCISKIQSTLDLAYCSELAARVFSMKTAHRNAEEMIDRLTLEKNKLRQANITREITEIITGAEGR